jgi:T-complex protein 1 subunit beta
MDSDRVKLCGTRVVFVSLVGIAELEGVERAKMRDKCDNVLSLGINCFVNRQLVYDFPEHIFTASGVCSLELVDFDSLDSLAKAVGGDIVSVLDTSSFVRIGHCRRVEQISIGSLEVVRFSGLRRGGACTIVLRGPLSQILDSVGGKIHDALCVLITAIKDCRFLYSAGNSEMQLSHFLQKESKTLTGHRSLVFGAFARSLVKIPSKVCENAGLDTVGIISTLAVEHRTS